MKKYLWRVLFFLIISAVIGVGLIFGCSRLEKEKKLTKAEKECISFQVKTFCIPGKRKCNLKNKEKQVCEEMLEKCKKKHTHKCKETLK